jgi:hypothetical protein
MSGASATDIITFIGIPLAVIGVLPILYNTTVTLSALAKVKRILKKSRLAAITRPDVINHVIEVEFPRFQIAPLHRDEDSVAYWSTYEHPSLVPGGSWTVFNWKTQTIGLKTQRIKYADELRQPQAEIGFEELISYLLDLGAVPNAAGFRMLRTSGLWVPTGTPLLRSPDRHEVALAVAPLNDSDSHLSLRVHWSRKWTMRDRLSLPPYWIQIVGPDADHAVFDNSSTLQAHNPGEPNNGMGRELASRPTTGFSASKGDTEFDLENKASLSRHSTSAVRCHISIDGLHEAVPGQSPHLTSYELDVQHIQIRRLNSDTSGVWFASTITALSALKHEVLWNYHIPEDIMQFARKDTIPCGILVMLGIVEESQTPDWATKYDDATEDNELRFKQMREEGQALMREAALPPAERAKAVGERQRKKFETFTDSIKEKQRREVQRFNTRMIEALQSPKWDNKLVAGHCLAWLKTNNHVPDRHNLDRAVEVIIYRMIMDKAFATAIVGMLDAWKGWVDGGGMGKAHYEVAKTRLFDFAYASLLSSIIRGASPVTEGSLAMDLQESVRTWKRVRVG